MKVSELINELQKQHPDKEIIMFDGPAFYTPCKVYQDEWQGEDVVIID